MFQEEKVIFIKAQWCKSSLKKKTFIQPAFTEFALTARLWTNKETAGVQTGCHVGNHSGVEIQNIVSGVRLEFKSWLPAVETWVSYSVSVCLGFLIHQYLQRAYTRKCMHFAQCLCVITCHPPVSFMLLIWYK